MSRSCCDVAAATNGRVHRGDCDGTGAYGRMDRPVFPELERCPKCGVASAKGAKHDCPVKLRAELATVLAERDELREALSEMVAKGLARSTAMDELREALRAVRAQLIKPRGMLVDCKLCGSCWAEDESEQHDQYRSRPDGRPNFDKLNGEECAIGKALVLSRHPSQPVKGTPGADR